MPLKAILIEGTEAIRGRMRAWQSKYSRAAEETTKASLLVFWENVPAYPPEPEDSTYTRTGQLGRSLGSSELGGVSGGEPDIFEVVSQPAYIEGSFGTNLEYAPHVVGSAEGEQAWMHKGRWWTLPETVLQKSIPKIRQLWGIMVEELAGWLEGRR